MDKNMGHEMKTEDRRYIMCNAKIQIVGYSVAR